MGCSLLSMHIRHYIQIHWCINCFAAFFCVSYEVKLLSLRQRWCFSIYDNKTKCSIAGRGERTFKTTHQVEYSHVCLCQTAMRVKCLMITWFFFNEERIIQWCWPCVQEYFKLYSFEYWCCKRRSPVPL